MPTTYADKSWKQNQFPELKPAAGELRLTRIVYDRWDGDVAGVLKAMKIDFIRPLADSLPFAEGKFGPIDPAAGSEDNPSDKSFQKQVITMCRKAGHKYKDKEDNDSVKCISDERYERNYEELTEIFNDVMVQLASNIKDPNMDIVFKEERKINHPLMAVRMFQHIKAQIYKKHGLDACIEKAQELARTVPKWTASGMTTWLSDLETAHLDIRHCGTNENTADACIVRLAIKAIG